MLKIKSKLKNDLIKMPFLKNSDYEMWSLVQKEELRQKSSINLIASENFASKKILETLGSCLTNKYSEGLPGKRYYGGNNLIDKIENICRSRALKAFGLDSSKWRVNVQPYSGSVANLAIMTGLLDVKDRIMGMELFSGGHLSHGHNLNGKNINCSAKFFSSLSYKLDPKTGLIDYKDLEVMAKRFWPKLIIAGASCYPRDIDYKKIREVSNTVNAYLMSDISHTSGLISSKLLKDPFSYSDIVMTTTHKTLGGPRGAIIFCKKELQNKIDFSVFPHCQGGPHNNNIASIAVQLKEVCSENFKNYARNIILNSKALAKSLIELGFNVCTGGTDNHIVLIDMKNKNIKTKLFEEICNLSNISLNRNSVIGDKSPFDPSGIRLGSVALTTRGLIQKDFKKIALFLNRAVLITKEFMNIKKGTKKDLIELMANNKEIINLKKDVTNFISKFDLPGVD